MLFTDYSVNQHFWNNMEEASALPELVAMEFSTVK